MALYDIDKGSEDRGTPIPNSHDTKIEVPAKRTVAGGTDGTIGLGTVVDKNLAANTITQGSIVPATLGGPHAFVSNDSSSGDYTDLQAAIDATFGVGGGIVFIRNGTYLLTNDIIVYDNVTLTGETAGGVTLDFQNAAYQIKVTGTLIDASGTVAVNNNSTAVVGTGTSFDSSYVGDSIQLAGRWFLIDAVADTTHLTIDQPFDAASVTGYATNIASTVSGITLLDFTVQNSTHANGAVFFRYATGITYDTITTLTSTIGLNVRDTYTVFLNNFSIIDCGTGFNFADSAVGTVYNFYLYASTGVNFLASNIYNMSVSNFTNSSAGTNNFTLTNCSNWGFYDADNGTATAIGIELISCADVEIFAMDIHDNGSDGIKLTSGNSRITIHNTSLVSNIGHGINIADNTSSSTVITACGYNNNTAGSLSDAGTSTIKTSNTPDSTTNNNYVADTDTSLAANSDSRLATQKATKTYVDTVATGLSPKPSALIATTTTLPTYTYLSGVITMTATGTVAVDGHTLATSDIILVKDETLTNRPYNGLYTVTTAGAVGVALVLTRHTSMDAGSEFPGAYVFVESGTVNQAAGFVCTNTSVTVGVTNVTFTQFSGLGEITAGNGLSKSANTLTIDTSITVDKTTSQALTNKDLTSGTNTFPTFNQNTSGSAAKWTTARNLAGNSVDGSANVAFANKFIVQGTADAGLSAAQFLGSLSTGIVKNTTTTGVLSIATNADLPAMSATVGGAVPTPPNDATKFLNGTGAWTAPSGTGSGVTGPGVSVNDDIVTFSGTTGSVIQDSGKLLPSGTVVGTSDTQTLTSKTLTTPKISSIFDTNGNTYLAAVAISSAVNYLAVQNGAAGNGPWIYPAGSDANQDLTLSGAGTGTIKLSTGGTVVGTSETQALTNKIVSDTFMGTSYVSQSKTAESVTLTASTDFLVHDVFEINSTSTVEIPATSTLEVAAYYSPTNLPMNKVMFQASCSAAFNSSAGAFVQVPFDTIITDFGANYSTANKNFIAPLTGLYHFSAGVLLPSTGSATRWGISIFKNGVDHRRLMDYTFAIAANTGVINGAGDVFLTAGDTVDLRLVCSGTTSTGGAVPGTTWFSGFLISRV